MISKQAKLKYLKRRYEELPTIEELLSKGDFAETALILHKVKGSASTFDLELLGTIAAALEQECLNPRKNTPAEALHLFSSYKENILISLEQLEN